MVEEIPARTGKMGHFYLGYKTQNFCRDENKYGEFDTDHNYVSVSIQMNDAKVPRE